MKRRRVFRIGRSIFQTSFVWIYIFSALAFGVDFDPASKINFRHYTPENGLPAAQVRRIMQDHIGFIWFATSDGLVRFDSREFRIYRHDSADPRSISDNILWDVVEDTQGNIWIGTDAGLDLWNRETDKFSHFTLNRETLKEPLSFPVRRILLEEDKCLWIGTAETGLYRMDLATGKGLEFRSNPQNPYSLSDDHILELYKDSRGFLWIGTKNGGLNRLDLTTHQFRVYQHDPGNPGSIRANQVLSIGEDLEGTLWMGTSAGISLLDRERRTFDNYPFTPDNSAALQGNIINAILRDKNGRMWIGSDGGGLARYEPRTRSFICSQTVKNDDSTLLSNSINAIIQDRDGDLWLGHTPAGVSYANPLNAYFRIFQSIPSQPGALPDDNIHSVLEDSSGNIWVGTDKSGLCFSQNSSGKWECYTRNPQNPYGISSNTIMALHQDYLGNIWIGSWKSGIDRFDPRTRQFRHFRPDGANNNTLSSEFVLAVAEDTHHRIWIGTYGGGLDRYDPATNQFTHYRHDPANPRSINHDTVFCIAVSPSGEVWAGTQAGLAKLNPSGDDWQRYQSMPNHSSSLNHNSINDILADDDGNLWIATNGGGLNHLNVHAGIFESFGLKEGLPSNQVYSLLEDQQGLLWLGTVEGLVSFNSQNRQIRIYSNRAAVPDFYFNRNSRWLRKNGELMFGGNKALKIMNPRMIPYDSAAPPVVITDVEIITRPNQRGQEGSLIKKDISLTRQLSVPSRITSVSFQFTALSFRSSEMNQYLYKLEGFDQEWRKAGTEQRATYTNLNPGTYYLRVKASNNMGVWNQQGATLELVVLPALWQTVWFKTGIAGFCVTLIAAVTWIFSKQRYRRRLAKARSENRYLQELQEASTALKDNDERLNLALEGADIGTWDWNVENGQFVFDHRWTQITGYSLDDFVPQYQTWIDLINPDDLNDVLKKLGDHLSGTTPNYDAEYRLRHKNGHWIRILNKGRVVQRDSAGKALRLSGTFQDVTARQQTGEPQYKTDQPSTHDRNSGFAEYSTDKKDYDLNDW